MARRNSYRIVRLKDKLGTRSMASGEIKFDGAVAYAVGKLDRGFVQMAEMVNWSRLSNGVKSTALMRRALHDAMTVAHGRTVFGKRIVDHPLARRQLMKIMLPLEQALSLCFATADALERAEQSGSQEAASLVRILTPVLKYRSTRDARKVTGDALEMRGGIGYVEEFVTPRLSARCPSRLDLGRHRQHRLTRCHPPRRPAPRRRSGARRRSSCAPARDRRSAGRLSRIACAETVDACHRLRPRVATSRRTRPMRGARPACSIMPRRR